MTTYELIVGEEAKWYDEGMMAFDDGHPYDSCPYKDEYQAGYWKLGYYEAEENPIN